MNQREVFQVVVRAVGLIVLLLGLSTLVDEIMFSIKAGPVQAEYGALYGVRAVFRIVAGIYLLRGAPALLELAFARLKSRPSGNAADVAPVEYDGPPCVSCGKRIPMGSTECPSCGWTQPG